MEIAATTMLKTMLDPSEAEQTVRRIAASIGLPEKSARLTKVCDNMRAEYLVASWQLSVLDSRQWERLEAPIGLAAAVKYYVSRTDSCYVQEPSNANEVPPFPDDKSSSLVALNRNDAEDSEVVKTVYSEDETTLDDETEQEGDVSSLSLASPLIGECGSQSLDHITMQDVIEDDVGEDHKNGLEKAGEADAQGHLSTETVSKEVATMELVEDGNTHNLLNYKNLNDVDSEITESETIIHQDDNEHVAMQPSDVDRIFNRDCIPSFFPDEYDIPAVTPTTSSEEDEEEDDLEEVVGLVESLSLKENYLWLDRDFKQSDDDATVVVSNVSPERKHAVHKEHEKRKAFEGSPMIAGSSTYECETDALQEILKNLPDKDQRNILSQLMIMSNARGQVPRIKLALQVKDALLESMEVNNVENTSDDAVRLIFHLARLKKEYRVMFGRSLFKAMSRLYKRAEKQKEKEKRKSRLSFSGISPQAHVMNMPEQRSSSPDVELSDLEATKSSSSTIAAF